MIPALGPFSPLRAFGSQGPRWPFRINRGHPLAKGLAYAFVPVGGQDSASHVVDLVSGLALSTVTGSPVMGGIPEAGGAFVSEGANAGLYSTAQAAWKLQPPLTLLAGIKRTGAISSNAQICGIQYSVPSGSPFEGYAFVESNNQTDYISMTVNEAGVLKTPSQGMPQAPLPLGEYHIWGGRFDVNAQALFRDGISVSTGAVTSSTISYSGSAALQLGETTASGRSANCRFTHVLAWNRALSDAEFLLASRPETRWELFSEDSVFSIIDAAATGGGTTSGTSAATSGATGTLTGTGALSGTSAATSGATGTLANGAAGSLTGTSAATSGATATLTAIGALIGSSQIVSSATGTLIDAIGHLSGTVAASSGATGTLRDGNPNNIWQAGSPASGTWTSTAAASGTWTAAS